MPSDQTPDLSVLVVEDSASMRSLVGGILQTMGISNVSVASEGARGWDVFQRENSDIVICDWLMTHGMDGISFTRKIRRDPLSVQRTVPIIMMSGYGARKRVLEARDAGVTEFLAKPFTAEELIKRINYVIERPRDFVQCATFIGPDRRRRKDPEYQGPPRRIVDMGHLTTQVYEQDKTKKQKTRDMNESDIIFE